MGIGNTIASLRKKRGMTQEQLGQAVGVSAQAVCKWEKGGTPDTEMLPIIAEKLGVTIDSLFGKTEEPVENMRDTLLRWIGTIPREKKMFELFKLLCATYEIEELVQLPAKTTLSSDFAENDKEPVLLRSALIKSSGIQMGISAEDFPVYLLMPEPKEGYRAFFADGEKYRKLFRALSLTGAIEVLCFLYSKDKGFYSVDAISKVTGIKKQTLEETLDAMVKSHLVRKKTVETGAEPLEIYEHASNEVFVPFMVFARWLCENDQYYLNCHIDRNEPLLREVDTNEKSEKK